MNATKKMHRGAITMMSPAQYTSLTDETIDAIEKLLTEVLIDSMQRLEKRIDLIESMGTK